MHKLPRDKDKKKWEEQRAKRGYSDYDTYGIYHWFTDIIPDMLEYKSKHFEDIPGLIYAEYCKKHNIKNHDEFERQGCFDGCASYYKETLQKMAFLFREANEHICSKKNPYQEEHSKAFRDYLDKYGLFGSKVKDSEYNIVDKNGRQSTFVNDKYAMSNLEEYKDISMKYSDEQNKIDIYQEKCRKKAFSMLRKYFYEL